MLKINHVLFFFGAISISAFSIPDAYSITFDDQTCLSLISTDQVKEITGFDDAIDARVINSDLAALNDDVESGCLLVFENEDRLFTISLSAVVSTSVDVTKEKFEQTLTMAKMMDIPVEMISENEWEYYAMDVGQSGIDSVLTSMNGKTMIGLNAPTTWHTVNSGSLLEMARVIHANVDNKPYEIKQLNKSNMPNTKENQSPSEIKQLQEIILNEKTCLSLISKTQAEDLIGNKFTLKTTTTKTSSHVLEQIWDEGAIDSCSVHIRNQDRSFEIIASVIAYETSKIAQSHYHNTLSQRQHESLELHEGKNEDWNYFLAEINFSGIGSGYNSVKDNMHLRLNVQPADPPIDAQTSMGFANAIQTSIDKLQNQSSNNSLPDEPKEGGGCLIATAAYGSEMAPQVQFLREIRDNTIMSTTSGTVFMNGFNQMYYSFSPYIADLQRENPIFKEAIKVAITPMISSLSILNYVNMDSEIEVLGYGISLIILNVGMYVGIPASVIFGIKKKF